MKSLFLIIILSVCIINCGTEKRDDSTTGTKSSSDRVLSFQEAGFKITIPASWTKEWYRVNQLSAADREEILPEAAHYVKIDYLPLDPLFTRQAVIGFFTVGKEAWEGISSEDGPPLGAVLGHSSDYTYLLSLPQSNPFPDTLDDYLRYNQLLRGLGAIITSFEILDGSIPPTIDEVTGAAFAAQLPAADASSRMITLRCSENGGASLTTEFIGKGELSKEVGEWSLEENILSYQPIDKNSLPKSAPLKWTIKGEFLIPLEWDRSLYGSMGLPLRRLQGK